MAHQCWSQVVELRAGQSISARSKSRRIHHVHHRTPLVRTICTKGDHPVPICTLHLQMILDLRGMRRGQHASVSGRRALTARYLSRYARRALVHTSHASACGVSDLQDGTCLGKRNGVRGARGVLRFPRSASAWRARARHVQLQRAPATCAPQWSNIVRIVNPSRTLALERKGPVNPQSCSSCSRSSRWVSPN